MSGASDEQPIDRRDLPPVTTGGRELRTEYARWLDAIDDELVGGGLLICEALPRVTAAFLAGDRSIVALTRSMVADVRERARFVEEQGFFLLAREAPVAGDLRRLVSILRLITDVERSASLVGHVAGTLEDVDPRQLPAPVRTQVEELGQRASEVFRQGLDAWRRRDGLALSEVADADQAVDALARGLVAQADQLTDAAQLIALGLLARYWERLADHGVSFAHHGTFAVTGERVEVGR